MVAVRAVLRVGRRALPLELGLQPGDLDTFVLRKDYKDVAGIHHLSWVQVVQGVPVFGNGLKANVTKPVVGYVAGFTAPEGKTMGHAGAIVSGSSGTAQAKKEALEAAGVKVGKTPSETADLMREILKSL